MIAAVCEKFPGNGFPHEFAGFEKDDFAGFLFSLEAGIALEEEKKEQVGNPGSTKSKIRSNSSTVKSKNANHMKHVPTGKKFANHPDNKKSD